MKTFIWATATQSSPERIAWLKENYNKPITLEEYAAIEQELPHRHKKPSRCKSPSACRYHYNRLKNQFGFFTPAAKAE